MFIVKVYIGTYTSLSFLLVCSGGIGHTEDGSDAKHSDLPKKEVATAGAHDDRENRIQAARERFLARKGKK